MLLRCNQLLLKASGLALTPVPFDCDFNHKGEPPGLFTLRSEVVLRRRQQSQKFFELTVGDQPISVLHFGHLGLEYPGVFEFDKVEIGGVMIGHASLAVSESLARLEALCRNQER